jgi:YVTN family beta-propeller protein
MKNKIFILFISFLVIFISFVAIGPVSHATGLYKVTFIENGLPSGANWSISINNQVYYSTNNTIIIQLSNGNYTFKVSDETGYTAYPSSGTIIVNGTNVTQNIQYVFNSQAKIIGTIQLNPNGATELLQYNPRNNYLYAGFWKSNIIYVINTLTQQVQTSITLPSNINFMLVLPNNKLYVLSSDANTIYVIDPSSNQIINSISIPSDSEGLVYDNSRNSIDFYSNSNGLYGYNLDAQSVSLITNKINNLYVSGGGYSGWDFYQSNFVVNGNYVFFMKDEGWYVNTYYYSFRTDSVSQINSQWIGSYPFYPQYNFISIYPNQYMFGTGGLNNIVYNMQTNTVKVISSGGYGQSAVYDPQNGLIYFDNGNVFNPITNTVIYTISGLSKGYGTLVFDPSNGYIYDAQNGYIAIINPNTYTIYQVNFQENGLNNQGWSVTLNGQTQYSFSNLIVFTVPKGTYYYSVSKIAGYMVDPVDGYITITSSTPLTTININYTLIPSDNYLITFIESGLPNGTTWSVTFNNQIQYNNGISIEFYAPNGTYNYSAMSSNSSYHTISGKVIVKGNTNIIINFNSGNPNTSGGGLNWYDSLTSMEMAMLWATVFSLIIGLITFLFYVKSEKHKERMSKSEKRKRAKKRRR